MNTQLTLATPYHVEGKSPAVILSILDDLIRHQGPPPSRPTAWELVLNKYSVISRYCTDETGRSCYRGFAGTIEITEQRLVLKIEYNCNTATITYDLPAGDQSSYFMLLENVRILNCISAAGKQALTFPIYTQHRERLQLQGILPLDDSAARKMLQLQKILPLDDSTD